MTRRHLRRSFAAVCAAVFAAGILGVAGGGSAGAEIRGQTATPPDPGTGVSIYVGPLPAEQPPQPIGPLSFT